MPILKVTDLKVYFNVRKKFFWSKNNADTVKAVDGISLDLNEGETIGIVGESGCGKSTLGRAILNLIKPTDGQVLWMGKNLANLEKNEMRNLRKDLQIIFQDPLASLNPRMTVGQIITEPLKTFFPNLSKAERSERVEEIMLKVGLSPHQINRYPHEFSGGQCQRIGIARSMILQPKLLVCDEPVSALDVSIQAQILNLLMDLQKETNISLIFISHDLGVVRHISHKIAVLYLGRVAEIAENEDLYKNPRHPYTQALISAVPIPDPDLEQKKQRMIIKGDLPSPLNPPSGCRFRTRCPKAQAVCAEVTPLLEHISPTHIVACHFWREP
ncbi:MAG: dipeptide ABC transporter ATP-binding protein [Alphaproteobacteria bacterium]|nr:dipeptide ABC transporter ATP-binding protein [Alphaproteobacteria bacterium]